MGRASRTAAIAGLFAAAFSCGHLACRWEMMASLPAPELMVPSSFGIGGGGGGGEAAVAGGEGGRGLSLLLGPSSPSSSMSSSLLRRSAGRGVDDRDEDPMLRHIVKGSGQLWRVWDRKAVLHAEAGVRSPCRWREFKPSGGLEQPPGNGTQVRETAAAPPSYMCLYPYEEDRPVSGSIDKVGHWPDCDALTSHLRAAGKTARRRRRRATYVDIGANIGACVMQVLLTTDADIIAFEPTPKNLFRLTSTLLNLPEHVKNRVTLFPIALGDHRTVSTVMASPYNAGNSQIKRSIGEKGIDGATNETHNIPVERVDDLLGPELVVDLIKMNVQGFECFVVDGMKRLLERTHKVMFEVEKNLYERFEGNDACSGARLIKALQLANFDITSEEGAPIEDFTSKTGDELRDVEFAYQDMFGTKRSNAQVKCTYVKDLTC